MNLFVFLIMITGIFLLPACREDASESATAQVWRDTDGIDNEGYDSLGFKEGLDRQGFDSSGCNKEGKDRMDNDCGDLKELKKNAVTWKKYDENSKKLSDEQKELTSLKTKTEAKEQALATKIEDLRQKRDDKVLALQQTAQKLRDKKDKLTQARQDLQTKSDTLLRKNEDLADERRKSERLDDDVRKKAQEVLKTKSSYERKLAKLIVRYQQIEVALSKQADQSRINIQAHEEMIRALKDSLQKRHEQAEATEAKLGQQIADALKIVSVANRSLSDNKKFGPKINGENLAHAISHLLASREDKENAVTTSPSKSKDQGQSRPNQQNRLKALQRQSNNQINATK